MGLENQGVKPSGAIGKIVGRLMNKVQTGLYVNYVRENIKVENSTVLDIGCGGGKFIQFVSKLHDSNIVYGIDHSPAMIKLSTRVKSPGIVQNRVKLAVCSVENLPFSQNKMNFVTAFETIQFWPNLNKSLFGIFHLLKPNGIFLIINRYPQKGTKWWELAQIKNDKEYVRALEQAGFNNITVDMNYKNGWIVITSIK